MACGHTKGVASTRQGFHRLTRFSDCGADAQMYVSSCIVSMSAGWNMNAEDAAAFAAAQQMQAAEAAREAQRAGGAQPNAHQD